jgi:hypothetical protein
MGAACWDPYREIKINTLERLQKEADKFANYMRDSIWETLTQRRTITRIFALFEAYSVERDWKAIGDRLQGPCHLGRDRYDRKISNRYREIILCQ